ncbi:MAG TPA: isoprenylcysteine carboxylmethyltransferase family protein [Rhizomicrobium sp.]
MNGALIIVGLWILFALSWIAAVPWSNKVEKRVGLSKELAYRIVLIVGGIVFFIPAHHYEGPLRLWYPSLDLFWTTVVAIVLGFAFAWWARIWLGSLWSGQVTKKENHRVVDTGPYRIVRHPIYTGILLATYATMALKGTILGIAGALIITLGLWMKARLEEGWLEQEVEGYGAYRHRVPMLLPFGPK